MTRVTLVGPADVLRALGELQPQDEATRASIVALLGFAPVGSQPNRGGQDPEDHGVDRDGQPSLPFAPRKEAMPGRKASSMPARALLREGAPRQRSGSISGETIKPLALPPEGGGTGDRVSAASLFRAEWQRATILTLISCTTRSGDVDIDALVDRVAQRKPVRTLPRLRRTRPARSVHLLLDRGLAMAPYRDDQADLAMHLQRLVGEDGLSTFLFSRDPARGVRRVGGTGTERYEAPSTATAVVITSWLAGAGDILGGLDFAGWCSFCRGLFGGGRPFVLLSPRSERHLPLAPRHGLVTVSWDRTSSPPHVRARLRSAT